MTVSPVMFSTGKDDWETPPELWAELNREFAFCWDVAANGQNYKGERGCFFGRGSEFGEDALSFAWGPFIGPCWCNPPYSRLQSKFIAKAALERGNGVTTVMLLPARTDTSAFHAYIWNVETHQPREGIEVRFLKGRLRFVGAPSSAPFPSMIVVFRPTSAAVSLVGAVDPQGEQVTERPRASYDSVQLEAKLMTCLSCGSAFYRSTQGSICILCQRKTTKELTRSARTPVDPSDVHAATSGAESTSLCEAKIQAKM